MQKKILKFWNAQGASSLKFKIHNFRKLERRVRIFQDISETDNPNENFFQIIILYEKTNKSTYCLLKRS